MLMSIAFSLPGAQREFSLTGSEADVHYAFELSFP